MNNTLHSVLHFLFYSKIFSSNNFNLLKQLNICLAALHYRISIKTKINRQSSNITGQFYYKHIDKHIKVLHTFLL